MVNRIHEIGLSPLHTNDFLVELRNSVVKNAGLLHIRHVPGIFYYNQFTIFNFIGHLFHIGNRCKKIIIA